MSWDLGWTAFCAVVFVMAAPRWDDEVPNRHFEYAFRLAVSTLAAYRVLSWLKSVAVVVAASATLP